MLTSHPAGRASASVAQSLMLRGTRHVGSGEYGQLLQRAGGRWAWRTGIDRSFFSVTVPSEAVALPLRLWSDQYGFSADTLTDARIAQQVAEIDDDYARRFEDVPLGHLWQTMDQALYPPSHPYHQAADRPGQSLRGLTVAEVRAFLERYYNTPDRARLVLSGAFNPARAHFLVMQYFGTLGALERLVSPPKAPSVQCSGTRRDSAWRHAWIRPRSASFGRRPRTSNRTTPHWTPSPSC